MSAASPPEMNEWRFYHFYLIVTGKGEERFLPQLFRSLTGSGHCHFSVIRRIPQLNPIEPSSKRGRRLTGVGGSKIPTLDQNLGLQVRAQLQSKPYSYVILIDDLEHDRAANLAAVFLRYRTAIDTILIPAGLSHRASVHFLVNMLEAYYFAHASAVNGALGTSLQDHSGDVEAIRHPKNDLKRLKQGFDEVRDGEAILQRLDVGHVLSHPERCAALRALFGWCWKGLGQTAAGDWCLDSGIYSVVTGAQIGLLGFG